MQSQLSLKSLFVKKISQGNFISDHNKCKLKNDTSNHESAFANTCYNTCNYDTQISVWFLILFTRILDFIEIKCLQVLNERLYTKRCLFLPYSKVSFDKCIIFLQKYDNTINVLHDFGDNISNLSRGKIFCKISFEY